MPADLIPTAKQPDQDAEVRGGTETNPGPSIPRSPQALEETGGNRTQAAKLLEISHPSLLSKIKTYEIDL